MSAEPPDNPADRYARPGGGRRSRGKAVQREQFIAARRGPVDPEELQIAVEQRRRQLARGPIPASGPHSVMRAAPAGSARVWVPLGPSVVLEGQAGSRPRVAGRVRDLQVSPDGQRVYAATANGGVWFSGDGGDSWDPLGGWAVTGTPPNITSPANVLVCGCIYVRFGATAASDEVLVGTGELMPQGVSSLGSGMPAVKNSGVGILRAVGPATAGTFAQVWNIEGTNLAQRGIFRLAADPDQPTPTTFVAATTFGLWMRAGAPTATWSNVPAAPFNTGARLVCTDVLWVHGAGATPNRLWVAVRDKFGNKSSLWVSDSGPAGPFTEVILPVSLPAVSLLPRRISLAAAPSDPSIVYALAEANLVWRLDNLTPTAVTDIPPGLLGEEPHRDQGDYDQAIAVHPTRPERIVLGGAGVTADGEWSASLYLADVTRPTPTTYKFGFNATEKTATSDDSYIGHGVHADVHVVRFARATGTSQLWVGCDGGVFRSMSGDADNRGLKHSFIARNTGIAALECGYVATHPAVDGYILAGTQDNGTLERIGDTVWRPRFFGDGGGVVFNPVAPQQCINQYHSSSWRGDGIPGYIRPVLRSTGSRDDGTTDEQTEDDYASFYSGADAIANGAAACRVAFGTHRVWFSENFGTSWQTLPSMADPMVIGSQNPNTDATVTAAAAGGAPDYTNGQVLACRWASPTRLYVLCTRAVLKFDFVADTSITRGYRVDKVVLTRRDPVNCEVPQADAEVVSPGQVLPANGSWSDLAIHDPAMGTHGSFYVAATGLTRTPSMDTLWWFDGDDRWHATNLRNDPNGIPAPAYAVVVDPDAPNIVYVGTAVGVWKGTLAPAGPSWTWEVLCDGLPEATVQDLTIFRLGGVKLLRAAIQARGVWEVDLASPSVPHTYLRVHAYDTRRQPTVSLTDPRRALPNTALSWHHSPDIRVRPRRGVTPPEPTGLPWIGRSSDDYGLWVFQTALHAKPDPLCRPDGQWTPLFDSRLRAATGGNRVTQAIWDNIVGHAGSFPNAYAPPWDAAAPTEADLLELIVDLRVASLLASLAMRRGQTKVDVLVHHRDVRPVPKSDVNVTLLIRDVTGTLEDDWSALSGGFTVPLQNFLRTAGAPPALPDGWTFCDAATPLRHPSAAVDARLPRSVTFDLNLSSRAVGDRLLLLAAVSSALDSATLANQTLETLVRSTRFISLRSIEIF